MPLQFIVTQPSVCTVKEAIFSVREAERYYWKPSGTSKMNFFSPQKENSISNILCYVHACLNHSLIFVSYSMTNRRPRHFFYSSFLLTLRARCTESQETREFNHWPRELELVLPSETARIKHHVSARVIC